MRLAILFVAGLVSAVASSAAPAREYPWCAVYGGSMNGSSNCGFTTRAQCLATVSGIGGDCSPNPFYKGSGNRKRANERPDRGQDAPYYSPSSGSWPSYFRN
jgi:uncharacterized protein DUF3551